MPRKKVIKEEEQIPVKKHDEVVTEAAVGLIDEYDPNNGLPFDNKERKEEELNPPVIVDTEPKEEVVTEELTESELENIIGGDNAISDSEIPIENVNVIEPVIYDKEEDTPSTMIEEIKEESELKKRMDAISFLKEYSKSTSRTVDEVSDKLGIPVNKGRAFVTDYINVVKKSIMSRSYPDAVLFHYNKDVIEDKAMRYYHLEHLKDIVLKYSQFDVNYQLNKTLNNDGNDRFISNKRVSSQQGNPLSEFNKNNNQPNQQQQQYNDYPISDYDQSSSPPPPPPQQHSRSGVWEDGDIREIRDGITNLQLIKFGLMNAFGQTAKMKISAMIGPDPTPYLQDEQKMKNLLLMSGATDTKATNFIEWLKTHARYVAQPVGFLNFQTNRSAYGMPGGNRFGMPQGNGMDGTMGGAAGSYYDQSMTEFYYQSGVYLPGLPPQHPINRENLQKYKQEKREEEELKMMNRKTEMAMRLQMLKSFSMMGGDGQGGAAGKSGGMFSPEMLLMTGLARYERTGVDEQGKPIYGVVPNIGGNPNYGGIPGQPGMPPLNPMDQTTSTLGLVKEIMQTMQMMNNQNKGEEQNLYKDVMSGLVNKALNPAPNPDPYDSFVKTFETLKNLSGGSMFGNGQAAPVDPMVQLETVRLQNDREFGMRALDLKEKDMTMRQSSSLKSESEANNNMKWLLETVSQTIGPLISNGIQLLFNRGGGGMMGGGPGGGGLGGLLGGMGGGGAGPEIGPAGDVGMGAGPGGVNNAALKTIIEMEYAKRKRDEEREEDRKKEMWSDHARRRDDEHRKEMEYHAELRRQKEMAAGAVQGPPTDGNGQPIYIPPQDQTVITEQEQGYTDDEFRVQPPINRAQVGESLEDQDITIETFLPHSADVIQTNVEKARKHKEFLERYIASGEEAMSEKIASGDVSAIDVKIRQNQDDAFKQAGFKEEEQPRPANIPEFFDNFPDEGIDPDYTGPEGSLKKTTVTTKTSTSTAIVPDKKDVNETNIEEQNLSSSTAELQEEEI